MGNGGEGVLSRISGQWARHVAHSAGLEVRDALEESTKNIH